MGIRASRLAWLVLPLLTVAVFSASEWPARAQMLEGPAREVWFPLAQQWENIARPGQRTSPVERETPVVIQVAAASPMPSPANHPTPVVEQPVSPPPPSAAAAPVVAAVQAAPKEGTILMLGDSLMGGVVAGLRPELPKTYRIVDRHKSSTGLTNRQYYDWPAVAKEATLETKPTWVVIHLGGNDGQDMLVNQKWVRFGSADWDALYTQRAEEMIQNVHTAWPEARILWLGLPAMRPTTYQTKSARIGGLQKAAAAAMGIPFVDAHSALGETYSKDGVAASGKREIWRLDDGIHYSRAGGGRLGRAVGSSAGWVF